MTVSSFFSSFLNVIHADAEEKEEVVVTAQVEEVKSVEEPAEAEEPEDLHPIFREECKSSTKCAPLARHFEHCQEKVLGGQGYKGEDCVEELMMHCVDACAGPKIFSKLK